MIDADPDAPAVVYGTRRSLRELVDGTLRVQIDIDPPSRRRFLELFPDIDTAVAIVPLRGPAFPRTETIEEALGLENGPQTREEPGKLPSPIPPPARATAAQRGRKDSGSRRYAGPLCQLAGRWCQEAPFQRWLSKQLGTPITCTADAAAVLRATLGIESRREIDPNPEVAAMFNELIRQPYQAYLVEEQPQ